MYGFTSAYGLVSSMIVVSRAYAIRAADDADPILPVCAC